MSDRIIYESSVGKMIQTTWEAYRGTVAVNPSSLAAGLRGVTDVDVRAIHAALTGERSEPSRASQDRMDRGSLLHMALLQPGRLATDVAVWRGWKIDPETIEAVKATYVPRKVGQKKIAEKLGLDEQIVSAVLSGSTESTVRSGARWEQFEQENSGKLILREADYNWVMQVYNELKNHPECGGMLHGGFAEVAMFVSDNNEECRGQVDWVNLDRRIIIDVKTTDCTISQDSCERQVRTMHYREKMALYRRWIAAITGTYTSDWKCFNLFIGMDEQCPAIGLTRLMGDGLDWAERKMINALQRYSQAKQSGVFPIFAQQFAVDVFPREMTEQEAMLDD